MTVSTPALSTPSPASRGDAPAAAGFDVGDARATLIEQVVAQLQRSGMKLNLSSQSPFRVALEQLGQTDHGGFYASHYSIHGTVGQGGIGRVFLAHDQALGRDVAIKELLPPRDPRDTPRRLNRFVREIKITGQLEHPGVVPVYEVGLREDGTLYYVMKYVRGKTMQAALDATESTESERPEQSLCKRLKLLSPLLKVCEAMSYAHSRGVVHRDLKPDNIVLGEFGETIILDWGLAKQEPEPPQERPAQAPQLAPPEDLPASMTLDGEILGTPAFMAPEQVDSRFGAVNARTDVYALGTILYVILTGELPYQGDLSGILARVGGPLASPSPRTRSRDLPPELVAICETAMDKDQARRFEHAGRLAEQLRAYRDGRIVSVYAYSQRDLVRRFVARHKAMLAGGLVAIIALITSASLAIHWAFRADAARQQAVEARGQADRARKRAEQAVEDVAGLANDLQRLADQMAASLQHQLETAIGGMSDVAREMGQTPLTDRVAMRPYLSALRERFPGCQSLWTIVPPGVLAAVEPDTYGQALGTDVTDQEHIRWVFLHKKPLLSRIFKLVEEDSYAVSLQVPILRDGVMAGALAAIVRPERVIPTLIPDELRRDKAARLWCIQDDGYVLYDNDLNQVGAYLFKDETCDEYPELRQFTKHMMRNKTGVGYFRRRVPDSTDMIQRVAAWETLSPCEGRRWKIVVVKPYEVDPDGVTVK